MLVVPNYANFTKGVVIKFEQSLILFFLPFFLSSFLLKVSKCSEEIKNYIEERSGEDPLVKIPEDKNPFKEKGSCIIS